jgi:hypothetical protein
MPESSESTSLPDEDVIAGTTVNLESTWKDASQRWGHSLHRLAPYVGGFPPSLAHYFIRRFSDEGDTVLDPFCGGGTTPLEAALQKRNGGGMMLSPTLTSFPQRSATRCLHLISGPISM